MYYDVIALVNPYFSSGSWDGPFKGAGYGFDQTYGSGGWIEKEELDSHVPVGGPCKSLLKVVILWVFVFLMNGARFFKFFRFAPSMDGEYPSPPAKY